ncbi:UNVERIFIED_CONTAM: hypothetical protein HDU68_009609 [Siphonaria sp. JEL0065]|nr:hypothetical protein HDU68_009609 [Siphonaria sp. JEL0065]
MSKVIVIGSGPAGALTAIALKQQGLDPILYDKVEPLEAIKSAIMTGQPINLQFGDVGGSVSLYGNGLKAMRNLGLLDAVEVFRGEEPLTQMSFMLIDGSDRIIRKFTKNKPGEILPLHVLRADLHTILMKEANKLGIKSFAGKKVKNITQTDSNVTVDFEDGTSAVGDFVVGADGIHSKTRKLIFEDAAKPVWFGTGYLGVFDRKTLPDGTKVDFDQAIGIYVNPVKAKGVAATRSSYWGAYNVVDMDVHAVDESLDDWRPVNDLPKEAEQLGALVDSWGCPKSLGLCIRHSKRIAPINLYDLPDLPALYKNRVLLVGDAAHGTLPTYGQGLNMAMEDAAALGDLFAHFKNPQDYSKVFKAYNDARLPRVHICAKLSRSIASRFKAPSNTVMRIGRFVMRLIFLVINLLEADDEMVDHDYRQDLVKAVPDIKFAQAV